MDGLLREGEQALEGQMGGNSNTQTNTGDDQGNMGGGDNQQQSGGNQSSGGGFLGGVERTGEDTMVNQGTLQYQPHNSPAMFWRYTADMGMQKSTNSQIRRACLQQWTELSMESSIRSFRNFKNESYKGSRRREGAASVR
jgi:hypothetical protein